MRTAGGEVRDEILTWSTPAPCLTAARCTQHPPSCRVLAG
jgi:hypothetical protein